MALLLLSGCSSVANRNNIINLLSSPKLSQRESEIVTAIKDYLGQDIILKYPKRGSNISPVQIADLNNDGVDEAVALYSVPSYGGNVRISVLSSTRDGWTVGYDSEGYGSEIYKISFDGLTQNGKKQIVVGYTFADSSEKFLAVYFVENNRVSDIMAQPCQDYMVYDVTGDGSPDIIVAGLNANNQNTQVKVLSTHYSNFLSEIAAKQLPVTNAKVTSMAFSTTDFTDNAAMLIDYYDTYRRVYTEAMYLDGNRLVSVLSKDVVQKIWSFDYDLNSRDVDGDGYIETPTIIADGTASGYNLKQMEWTNFMLSNPERKYYGVCEANSGVFFALPDEWQNLITLVNGDEGTWQVTSAANGAILVEFDIVSAGEDNSASDNTVTVSSGTIQVKITFDTSVTSQQREYISSSLMYIK